MRPYRKESGELGQASVSALWGPDFNCMAAVIDLFGTLSGANLCGESWWLVDNPCRKLWRYPRSFQASGVDPRP